MRLASEVKRLHVSLIRGRSRVRAMPWSKLDPGSAIDRILFELVEREFKAVYVIKKLFFVLLSFPQRKMFFFCLVSSLGKRKSSESSREAKPSDSTVGFSSPEPQGHNAALSHRLVHM